VLGWQEVVLIFAILLLVFGPTKLPKIARDLGNAVREFNKASSGFMEEINKASSGFMEEINKAGSGVAKAVSPSPTRLSEPHLRGADRWKRDRALSDIAEKLNIATEGKTRRQITQEIIEKIESKKEKTSDIKTVKR